MNINPDFSQATVQSVVSAYPHANASEAEWTRAALNAFCKVRLPDHYSTVEIANDLAAVEGGFKSCWIDGLKQAIISANISDMEKGFFLGCLNMRNVWELKGA